VAEAMQRPFLAPAMGRATPGATPADSRRDGQLQRSAYPPDAAADALRAQSSSAAVQPRTIALNPAPPGVAALLLVRLPPGAVPWALWRLARGARAWAATPGLRFARVLGSGRGGGFGLAPGLDHQGVFAMFDSVRAAETFVTTSPCATAYRERASEFLAAVLLVTHSRGSWAGQAMQPVAALQPQQPVAALTRASIRAPRAAAFWRHAAPSQAALAQAPGCWLAAGLGEAPLLRQATFSVWESAKAMEAYARQGAHQQAAAAVVRAGCFSESMFARFVPWSLQGRWQGRDHG
jgi:spheroidene monooxygenase